MDDDGTGAVDPSVLLEAEELRVAVGRFVRQVRGRDGLPEGQAATLGHLARDGDLAITALADRERVRHQSMARTVKVLAANGLVEVRPDVVDRRRSIVRLAAAGRDLLEADRRWRSARIAAAIAGLQPGERELLARLPAVFDHLGRHLS